MDRNTDRTITATLDARRRQHCHGSRTRTAILATRNAGCTCMTTLTARGWQYLPQASYKNGRTRVVPLPPESGSIDRIYTSTAPLEHDQQWPHKSANTKRKRAATTAAPTLAVRARQHWPHESASTGRARATTLSAKNAQKNCNIIRCQHKTYRWRRNQPTSQLQQSRARL